MDADSLRQSKKKKCKAFRVERIWSLKILVLQMSFFQFYMPRSVLNSPKSNFPSPFGSAASIISCVQEDSSEEVVSKFKTEKFFFSNFGRCAKLFAKIYLFENNSNIFILPFFFDLPILGDVCSIVQNCLKIPLKIFSRFFFYVLIFFAWQYWETFAM